MNFSESKSPIHSSLNTLEIETQFVPFVQISPINLAIQSTNSLEFHSLNRFHYQVHRQRCKSGIILHPSTFPPFPCNNLCWLCTRNCRCRWCDKERVIPSCFFPWPGRESLGLPSSRRSANHEPSRTPTLGAVRPGHSVAIWFGVGNNAGLGLREIRSKSVQIKYQCQVVSSLPARIKLPRRIF